MLIERAGPLHPGARSLFHGSVSMSELAHYVLIPDIISAATHAAVLQAANNVPFRDGRETAGTWEGHRKHNAQAEQGSIRSVCDAVMNEIMLDKRLREWALPHEAVQPILNRYRVGDAYGLHEDSPLQSGIRSDLSYTLFLSDPHTYQGGELVLGTGDASVRIKLPARALVCYASGTPHQVTRVADGERLALVGWMRSIVRDPAKRQILRDLKETTDALAGRDDTREPVARLSRVYGGLLRRWAFA